MSNISWGNYLFGFSGRINRAKWWLAVLILIVVNIMVAAVTMVAQSDTLNAILSIAFFVFSMWLSLAVGAKRLHDLDRTAAWLVLFVGGPFLLLAFVIGIAGISFGSALISGQELDVSQIMRLGGYALIVGLLSLALSIWALIWFGCLRGTVGPNQYGPDPLQQPVAYATNP